MYININMQFKFKVQIIYKFKVYDMYIINFKINMLRELILGGVEVKI